MTPRQRAADGPGLGRGSVRSLRPMRGALVLGIVASAVSACLAPVHEPGGADGPGGAADGGARSSDGGICFGAPASYPVGSRPWSIATGDFNGDGRPDLAVANGGAGTVGVLLNQGGGHFASQVGYPAGNGPAAVAVGDFNGDGRPDLAVANGGDDSVSVLLGRGDGSFASPVSFPVGTAPGALAAADLDGDGRLDLAVVNRQDGNVGVLLGRGDGTFAAQRVYPAGTLADAIAVGDFDGDGRPDLAVANMGSEMAQNLAGVNVLLNRGGGAFAPAVAYAAGDGPTGVTAGDFTGTGKLDLAVTDNFMTLPGAVSVLLHGNPGTFGTAASYPAGVPEDGSAPTGVAVGDFNGDGRLDIVVANRTEASQGGDTVGVFLNQGAGTFAPQVVYPAASGWAVAIAVADFDGDGRPDLAVVDSYDSTVNVLLGCN